MSYYDFDLYFLNDYWCSRLHSLVVSQWSGQRLCPDILHLLGFLHTLCRWSAVLGLIRSFIRSYTHFSLAFNFCWAAKDEWRELISVLWLSHFQDQPAKFLVGGSKPANCKFNVANLQVFHYELSVPFWTSKVVGFTLNPQHHSKQSIMACKTVFFTNWASGCRESRGPKQEGHIHSCFSYSKQKL